MAEPGPRGTNGRASNVQPGPEAAEGKGRWAAGLGPCKGCHVGESRPQFHKINTLQQTEYHTSSRGVFVMRNCASFPCSGTFCGSPSPARDETTQPPRSAFKALFTSLCASLLPPLFMHAYGLPPPAFTYTFPATLSALPPGKPLHILQDPDPMSPSLGNIALPPGPQGPYLL